MTETCGIADGGGEQLRLPSALTAIGHTPLVPLRRLVSPGSAQVLVKLEYFNPTGSYKDRMALAMIEEAERRGQISPGRSSIIEFSGGNTGASLAFVCAIKGYRLQIVSSDAFSEEKLRSMTSLGAKLDIVPSDGGGITPGLLTRIKERTQELAGGPDTYWTDQFNNPDNSVGQRTMGREILQQTGGRVDAFVASVATAGCAMGVAYELKKHDRAIQVGVVEPTTSAVISGGPAGSHRVEGIAVGFIPPLLDSDLYDEVLVIAEAEARDTARRLAAEEGILTGTSSGMNVAAALRVAAQLDPGATVVTVAVDSGLKYISTDLYPRG